MKNWAFVVILFTLAGVAHATHATHADDRKIPEMWISLHDEPTGVFPHEKDYRVFFANHSGVYYLRASDPTLKQDLALIQKAIAKHQEISAEAEATYLTLRKIQISD